MEMSDNIANDPEQRENVADENSHIASLLRDAYEDWWDGVSHLYEDICPIYVGTEMENPACLSQYDVFGDIAWSQIQIAKADKNAGKWYVNFTKAGKYKISLCRWPMEVDLPINEGMKLEGDNRLTPYYYPDLKEATIIKPTEAVLEVFDKKLSKTIQGKEKSMDFILNLPLGETFLTAKFRENDLENGAYYVYIEYIEN